MIGRRPEELKLVDLSGAVVPGAGLQNANLSRANRSDANLTRADLTDVGLNNREQLSRACGKPKVLPEGFTLDKPCPKNPN